MNHPFSREMRGFWGKLQHPVANSLQVCHTATPVTCVNVILLSIRKIFIGVAVAGSSLITELLSLGKRQLCQVLISHFFRNVI